MTLWRRFLMAIFTCACMSLHAALPEPDADNGGLTLPPGFHALVVADHLPGVLRSITVAANGDIYVRNQKDGIFALRDTKGTGRADAIQHFASGPGTDVQIHGDYLYYSTNEQVLRYKMQPGELVPTSTPEVIVTGLPPGQREHETKVFCFDDSGHLYVEVGCPSNNSAQGDRGPNAQGIDPTNLLKQHGGYWRFEADKLNQDQVKDGFHFATGMRHSVSVAWHPLYKKIYTALMGRDQLGTVDSKDFTAEQNAELPAEEFHELKEGSNFGWPFGYWDPFVNARMLAPEFGGDGKKKLEPNPYQNPLLTFPAHWAPLQMCVYTGTQFPEKYRNGIFISFHGSWNRAPLPQAGYRVEFVPFQNGAPAGTHETFADNFAGLPVFYSPGQAKYRPSGCAMGPDGSLYVSETQQGRLWRIIYTGK